MVGLYSEAVSGCRCEESMADDLRSLWLTNQAVYGCRFEESMADNSGFYSGLYGCQFEFIPDNSGRL